MKKILLIIILLMAIFQMVVLAAINIGSPATDRDTAIAFGNYTLIFRTGPANASGVITTIKIWANNDNLENCEVAIFFVVSGNNLSTRSNVTLGTVIAGSEQTFTEDSEGAPISMDVEEGDYIGIHYLVGRLEADTGGAGWYYTSGDYIPCTNKAFTLSGSTYISSLYGYSEEEEEEEANVIFMGTNF